MRHLCGVYSLYMQLQQAISEGEDSTVWDLHINHRKYNRTTVHWWESPHIEHQHTVRLKLLHLTLPSLFPSLSLLALLSHCAPSVALTIYDLSHCFSTISSLFITMLPCSSKMPFGIFLSTVVTTAFLWFFNLPGVKKPKKMRRTIT